MFLSSMAPSSQLTSSGVNIAGINHLAWLKMYGVDGLSNSMTIFPDKILKIKF